jgi:putative ABC transport system permease protein
MPHAQIPGPWLGFFRHMTLAVRTESDPESVLAAVRTAVASLDKDLPVYGLTTMTRIVAASLARRRASLLLLGGFGMTALLLAGLGLYGVIAYSVAQRTHEIGVRVALGAARGDVVGLVLGEGLRLTLVGLGLGLPVALAAARLASSFLYGVAPWDPVTIAAVAVLLAAAALLASYLPARRATRVDPLVACVPNSLRRVMKNARTLPATRGRRRGCCFSSPN